MKDTILIPIEMIRANRYQPRLEFDEAALNELAASIREHGLIQPITVRQIDDHYEIIAGERRLRACSLAEYKEVPCYVLTPTEDEAAQMALVENVQRENLTAIEEAKAYVQIMRQACLTQEQVASRIGKSQSTIANKIRLLNLADEVQEGILTKKISERHGRALLSLNGPAQVEAYHVIVDKGLNVRDSEKHIENVLNGKKKKKPLTKGFTRSVQIGLNTVNQCMAMMKKTGISFTSEQTETDKDVRITIRFPK
ncbi:MAG: ParB/RepB/Spo0J family partition protein [Erysipelotrichaceae bacterium]|nr:ParB/RepB/Spo0J family partition protein [Erysipelotrichaceae bacterium]